MRTGIAPRRRRKTVLAVLAIVLSGALVASSCADTSPEHQREAVVYEVIVRWILDREIPPGTESPVPLFFESLGLEAIPLEVQVELIDLLRDDVEVRFIDHRAEALDADDPMLSVNDGGALVGLGPITDERPVKVRVELYRSIDNALAYRFDLAGSGSSWRITQEPELLPVEDLNIDDGSG